ncbi:MAG: dihydroorotate dehydrogenase-like protein [Anaerolineaceae bacterium]|nr:dihydroorotate dehydrogenase-like protein [Anaerolineaceae bacterium]
MAELKTSYLGLPLKNPLIAGASPFSVQLDVVRQLEDSGVSALVMHSLFEEEITHESLELDYFLNKGTESQPEAQTYLPEPRNIETVADKYIAQLQKIKASVEIPVIASLNGTTPGGWVRLAKDLQAAGADALELNIYTLITDPALASDQVEKNYLSLIQEVCKHVSIPVAVKLSPFLTTLPRFLARAYKAGAEGFVLFNRFMQPIFDIESLEVERKARLSTSADLALPARWIAIASSQLKADFALSGGVHSPEDMVKAIMAGAKVSYVVSALLANGPKYAARLLNGLAAWMDKNGYESVEKMRGALRLDKIDNPAAYERANYLRTLKSFDERVL